MTTLESLVLSYLLNSLWQLPLLFVAGWLAARALRPAGPAAEHRVWVAVLLLQTILPALSLLPLAWFPALFASPGLPSSATARVTVIMGPATAFNTGHLTFWTLTALIYLALTTCFAARFLWSLAKLRALRRQATTLQLFGPAALCWQQCRQSFQLSHVTAATSSRVYGPVTLGSSRRLVLFPAGLLARLPQPELRAVIAHEFAHIRRNDFLKNLIYELLALPISYHPILWLTRERVIESREVLCDHIAAETGNRRQYAQSLLHLASLLVPGVPARTPNTIGIFDAGKFERRIMRLTRKSPEMRGLRRASITALCLAFGLATCASALALRTQVDTAAQSHVNHPHNPNDPIKVAPDVIAGTRISGSEIKYPVEAKKKKIQGTVILDAIIAKDGTIKHLTVKSGPKELQRSALDAVHQWKYKPFLLNGNPVEVQTTIRVVYSLAN
jgi:TonB family protein